MEEHTHIGYFSVAVIKQHDQGDLQRAEFLGLWFQRDRVHNGEVWPQTVGMMPGAEADSAHLPHDHEAERVN